MPRAKKALTGQAEEAKPMKKTTKKEAVEASVSTAPKSEKGMSMDVIDVKGGKTTMTVPAEVFGVKVNKTLLSQAIRVYLANQRAGSANVKTRGEVEGSTRKIYQQKGTGRARHGGVRAPIFVHGGVAHGPRLHDFALTMPQKMRKQALFSALTSKKEAGEVVIVKGLETLEAKTKAVAQTLKKIGVNTEKSIMVVLPESLEKAGNVVKAARNIAGVELTQVQRLNTYEVLRAKTVLFMQDAIASLKGEAK